MIMRLRTLLFFLLSFLIALPLFAQQDCITPTPICQNIVQGFDPTGTGSENDLVTANWDCFGEGEHNSHFYIFNVSTPGTLVFTIRPDRRTPATSINDSIADFDFMIWEVTTDRTSPGCAPCDIVHNTPPIRCNYAGLPIFYRSYAMTLTGLSTTATTTSSGIGGPAFNSAINATAGQTYILMIDQTDPAYSLDYKIDFTGSTAGIAGTTPPTFAGVSTPCGYTGDNLIADMSQLIQTGSIAVDGSDFFVTDAAGTVYNPIGAIPHYPGNNYTRKVLLEFGSAFAPGNYTLHARTGTDGNTVQDLCTNQQAVTDNFAFTLTAAPAPPAIRQLDTPACKKARIILTRPVMCSTIAKNGSDFKIAGPGNVAIIAAVPYRCKTGTSGCNGPITVTDTIDLFFDKAISVPGNYTLEVVIGTDGNRVMDSCLVGISNTYTFTVSDQGYVSAAAVPALLCNPGYTTLSATLTVPPAAVLPVFTWSPGDLVGDSTAGITTAYVLRNTTYNLTIQDTNGCYRRSSTSVVVSVRHPSLSGNDTAVCAGTPVYLHAGGGNSYFWYPSAGLSCTTCTDPVANPAVTTTYSVVITDALGCSDTLSRTITVYPLPAVYAGKDTTVNHGTQLQLYALAPAGKYYMWDPIIGMNNANIPNPVTSPPASVTYIVYVVDTNYCKNTDTIQVNIRTDIAAQVPSGFTPNNDGKNDRFRVANLTFQKIIEFRVFNRWGQEVYTGTDNAGWDGNTGGKASDAGEYKYIIRVAYPDRRIETLRGDVTLIR